MGLDPDALSMLEGRAFLQRFGEEDKWGNNGYSEKVVINIYLDSGNAVLASLAQNGRADHETVVTATAMTDALGIRPLDLISPFDPRDPERTTDVVYQVQTVATTYDEYGVDLYQNLTLSTTNRG